MSQRRPPRSEPVRSCAVCRRRAAKDSLVRLVRGPDGEVRWDPGGKAPGRGAYVCPSGRCLEQVAQKGRLARALRTPLGARDTERLARTAPQAPSVGKGSD
ncbi:MAG TPA: YlxR family protein [Actinomycetota bacterium]|nr:YlxR family protein [Actinomycetota bacterium]